jgi:uncharacterized protein YceH (UPF0502 family)
VEALLDSVEVRVLGALIEKQVTTPEYYPLTLNAVVHACNQISNRDPVVSFDEKTVARALESLRERNLAYVFYGSDSRVPKYKHVVPEVLHLSPQELAVMCVLMLRGPQTIGEIRGRTGRFHQFSSLAEVEQTVEGLIAREDSPLVSRLPRQMGQKEVRYAHLLAGELSIEEQAATHRTEAVVLEVRAENERIARLEDQVGTFGQELADLRREFEAFKKQFE